MSKWLCGRAPAERILPVERKKSKIFLSLVFNNDSFFFGNFGYFNCLHCVAPSQGVNDALGGLEVVSH